MACQGGPLLKYLRKNKDNLFVSRDTMTTNVCLTLINVQLLLPTLTRDYLPGPKSSNKVIRDVSSDSPRNEAPCKAGYYTQRPCSKELHVNIVRLASYGAFYH